MFHLSNVVRIDPDVIIAFLHFRTFPRKGNYLLGLILSSRGPKNIPLISVAVIRAFLVCPRTIALISTLVLKFGSGERRSIKIQVVKEES